MGAKKRSGQTAAKPTTQTVKLTETGVREVWLQAVQQEDAAKATECAKLCETLAGADLLANTDGLDALVAVAMGQSTKGGQGGLMVALSQALMKEMDDYKVAVFEVLAAAARWPSLRGRISGSGVLGVVTATLLAPHQQIVVKALMMRLCGLLCVDTAEAAAAKDEKRAEEFAKLRTQLILANVHKALAELAKPGADPVGIVAAAEAIAALAGCESDLVTRVALTEAQAVGVLISHLPEGETFAETSLLPALQALTKIAPAKGDGVDDLLKPIREGDVLRRLRVMINDAQRDSREVEEALRCLASLSQGGIWFEDSTDLVDELTQLVTSGGATVAVAELLDALLADGVRVAQLGDLNGLRRAAVGKKKSEVVMVLDRLCSCDACGVTSTQTLLRCGGCDKAKYCSKKCQKHAWKSHKSECAGSNK